MMCEVGLIIDWEVSEISSDDRVIDTQEALLEYIIGTLESNACFDHVSLKVKNHRVMEITKDMRILYE